MAEACYFKFSPGGNTLSSACLPGSQLEPQVPSCNVPTPTPSPLLATRISTYSMEPLLVSRAPISTFGSPCTF